MTSLKELFDLEIRSSMLFLCVGISTTVSLIVGFFQYQQLNFDFTLTKNFIEETTKNALVLEQPILIQRSISEFWKAFEDRDSAIIGLELYFDDALVSQNGSQANQLRSFSFVHQNCLPSSRQEICLRYLVDPIRFLYRVVLVFLTVVLSAFCIYVLRRRVAASNVARLAQPLEHEISRIAAISDGLKSAEPQKTNIDSISLSEPIAIKEVSKLSDAYRDLLEHNQNYLNLEKSMAVSRSLGELATRVAHDIRSPLSALNIVIASLEQMPQDKRSLIRNAVQRINDIADSLLEKGKSSERLLSHNKKEALEVLELESEVHAIVSEKLVQFRETPNIEINFVVDSYSNFLVKINSIEFKRVLSNLINNAVESLLDERGRVSIQLKAENNCTILIVSDEGKGMPDHIVERLMAGESRVSYGKDNSQTGSGIGVYHAKKTIESFGGSFSISSRLGNGTHVTLTFPLVLLSST